MSRRQPFSSLGATSLEHKTSVLARHASAEAMRLCAASVVRLKSALRHRNEFSLKTKMLRLAAPSIYVKETATDYTVIKAISAVQEVSVSSVAKHTLSNSVVY